MDSGSGLMKPEETKNRQVRAVKGMSNSLKKNSGLKLKGTPRVERQRGRTLK